MESSQVELVYREEQINAKRFSDPNCTARRIALDRCSSGNWQALLKNIGEFRVLQSL